MKYFALAMSLIYVVAGAMLLFTNFLAAEITSYRVPLALVLIGYGVMRWFMWRRKQAQGEEGR